MYNMLLHYIITNILHSDWLAFYEFLQYIRQMNARFHSKIYKKNSIPTTQDSLIFYHRCNIIYTNYIYCSSKAIYVLIHCSMRPTAVTTYASHVVLRRILDNLITEIGISDNLSLRIADNISMNLINTQLSSK